MTATQVQLLKEIEDNFDPNEDERDLMILYEMTGFKMESEKSMEWFEHHGGELGYEDQKDSEVENIKQEIIRNETSLAINE